MIELRDLTIGYRNLFGPTKVVREHLNQTYEDNKVYGLLAKSGGGKSTLLKTVCGLIQPLGGAVLIDGHQYRSASDNPVFMLPQAYTSFNDRTCVDNVLIVVRDKRQRNREDAIKMLESVGLAEHADHYPTQLSGGMRQRLALARVLYARPKYLLMDEPMSALDNTTRAAMQDLVLQYHRATKNLIILVTHSPEEAERMCDTVMEL